MRIFKNKNYIKRNYECTNVVFCKSEIAPDDNWIECNESDLDSFKCDKLYCQAGVTYYGYL